jgi:archaellum biogenesis ATPase FlaH
MKDDSKKYNSNEKEFVFTETPIPCKALELFKVGQEFIDIKKNVYITSIEKSTGLEGITIINNIDDNYIKNYMKDIKSDIRKTDKIIKIETSRFSCVKDVPFPLVKVQ